MIVRPALALTHRHPVFTAPAVSAASAVAMVVADDDELGPVVVMVVASAAANVFDMFVPMVLPHDPVSSVPEVAAVGAVAMASP
ncbi:MAG: hypothetical protein ACYTFA_19155, partial [Planctomycetota bacterium]